VKEVSHDRTSTYLSESNIVRIYESYKNYRDEEGFCKVVSIEDALAFKASLNMALYVSNVDVSEEIVDLDEAIDKWSESSKKLKTSMSKLFKELD
jgi:type I restriction enzyme M protein